MSTILLSPPKVAEAALIEGILDAPLGRQSPPEPLQRGLAHRGPLPMLPEGAAAASAAGIFITRKPFSAKTGRMPDPFPFTLRQIDQARADFAAIESDLRFVMAQLARVPTRRDLAKTALSIIFCSGISTTLFVWIVWH